MFDDDDLLALGIVAIVVIVMIIGAVHAYETKKFVEGGYCQTSSQVAWMRCDPEKH